MEIVVYDVEIALAIPSRDEPKLPVFDYCEGWGDKSNMGVACAAACVLSSTWTIPQYRVFFKDNLESLKKLLRDADLVVGHNILAFDNELLKCEGLVIPESKCYDTLRESWLAAGLEPQYKSKSHAGFSLDSLCEANFGEKKIGNGAFAPLLFQVGKYGELVDYCLRDVWLTVMLFKTMSSEGRQLRDPRNLHGFLNVARQIG